VSDIGTMFDGCTSVMSLRARRSKLLRSHPERKQEINIIFTQLLALRQQNAEIVYSAVNALADKVIDVKSMTETSFMETRLNPDSGELEISRPAYACPILSEYYVLGTPLGEKHFKLKEQQPPHTILCTLLDNLGRLGAV